MQRFKDFIKTKAAKRFLWTILNALMGMAVAFLTFIAADVELAAAVLPFSVALSQALTRFLNR